MITSPALAARSGDLEEDWRHRAACRGSDVELFFPDGDASYVRSRIRTAKLICRGCPVRGTCLTTALASDYEAGIWGGLTEEERHRLRRSRRRGIGPRIR